MNLATIVKIKSFTPIPNKDLIHTVHMEGNGWQVVCKKTDFQIGDLAVFFVIDTLVDSTNPAISFMESHKWRVWNCKFGGAPSQGLLMPLSILTHYGVDISTVKEGDDVTEITKTIKYERPLHLDQVRDAKGHFPSNLISITDEDNLKSNIKAAEEFGDDLLYITLKIDGSSYTATLWNEEFNVCSRRLTLKPSENAWWRVTRKYDIENKLRLLQTPHSIQGECYGEKLNGNVLGLKGEDLMIFNVKDLATQKWYGYEDLRAFCERFELKMVPTLKLCKWSEFGSIDKLQDWVNTLKYENGKPAEGVVIRPIYPKWSTILGKYLSVKLINQFYKE